MRRLSASRRDSDLAYLALLALVFAISRAAVYGAGVRFATGQLTIAIQNLDPELLRHRLLESVWYLHIQPPLWNLGLGVVLKLFPSHWGAAFHVLYLALGLIEIWALYALISGFGLPRPAAAAVAAFVSVSPDVMLYENWLFYDYPLLVLLTLSAVAAQRYARTPTFWRRPHSSDCSRRSCS